LIITAGENAYTAEVEAVLHRHPAVAEGAVIGVPDDRLGELVMAVIVLKPGAQTDEETIALHCRKSLGGFKVPRRFALWKLFPRLRSGKY
jgi:acyl-CoA synthetase (AMP-forming)/AMP-acid ligase II